MRTIGRLLLIGAFCVLSTVSEIVAGGPVTAPRSTRQTVSELSSAIAIAGGSPKNIDHLDGVYLDAMDSHDNDEPRRQRFSVPLKFHDWHELDQLNDLSHEERAAIEHARSGNLDEQTVAVLVEIIRRSKSARLEGD